MFDTMTITKVLGATCGSLLVFLFASWAAQSLYSTGGGHGGGEPSYVIETAAAEAPAPADEASPFEALLASADAAAGERSWSKCRACHKVDGKDGTGPHLNGVVGRGKASVAGFNYSATLVGMAADQWTPENLNGFLENPKAYAPGTKMSFAGIPRPEERANLIAWLATQN